NWKTQQPLRFIRANVHLIVVPLLNPDGFNLNTRKNGNNVDINRNFPADWTYNPDKTSLNYTGEEHATEPETQIMMQFLADNPDLYFAVDYHNYTTLSDFGDVSWVGADNLTTLDVAKSWARNYDME